MAADSEKRRTKYTRFSVLVPALHCQRSRTAHRVVEELESHGIPNRKFVERRALVHVASMEEHITMVRQPDEAVAVSDEQRDDSPRPRRAATFGRSSAEASRRRLASGASSMLAHVATSVVPTGDDATVHR